MTGKYLMRFLAATVLCPALVFLSQTRSQAESHTSNVSIERGGVLRIEGNITQRTTIEVDRLLTQNSDFRWLELNSPGGSVYSALLIARKVRSMGLGTKIEGRDICASACAIVFAAGKERIADGLLGVHQMSMDVQDNEAIQYAISDLLQELNTFNLPVDFITKMLGTPSNSMYWFNDTEIKDMGFYFGANRQTEPQSDSTFEDPDVPLGSDYLERAMLFIEAYFDQAPERELFQAQTLISSWYTDTSLDFDGMWGPETSGAFLTVLELYTDIGGNGPSWGVNSVSDVPRFLSWLADAAYANNNPGQVEFPD